ncbi:MtnX-like HAD-IB family phosphatase [Priestia flexa]|uniref:MtnX-like HAD-IB family phosphatase n=1 Tax=Priestia flexa TaxID=86664 RepID=UPI001B33C315|nr:MtnX-like HAD-IB family phosphatase [Priestia flexa]USY56965.1 MtnX-like HAD-IB family phosphatase [Bacillus sp. 1780r2a1]
MKRFAFVSDFDGTISQKDFYWIVIEKYFPEGRKLYTEWKAGKLKDIDFLSTVFSSINQNEDVILQDIDEIEIDPGVPAFIGEVQKRGGDFYILSAGSDYYIRPLLKKHGVENVEVLSNTGVFQEKNVHLQIDPKHWSYSDRYGIDKSLVIQDFKKRYEQVYFAGDSEPDSHPAAYADITFAKSALQDLLDKKNVPHVKVASFQEITSYFNQKGLWN